MQNGVSFKLFFFFCALDLESHGQEKEKSKEKRVSRLDTQTDLFDQMTSVFADAAAPTVTSASKTEVASDVPERDMKTAVSVLCRCFM